MGILPNGFFFFFTINIGFYFFYKLGCAICFKNWIESIDPIDDLFGPGLI